MNDAVTEVFKSAERFNQELVEPVNQIAFNAQKRLLEQHNNLLETLLDVGRRQLASISELTDPRLFLAAQADVAAELGEKLLAAARDAVEVQIEVKDKLAQLTETAMGQPQEAPGKLVKPKTVRRRTTRKAA